MSDSDTDSAAVVVQASLAEAEEELSRAEAQAEAARARADELRRRADEHLGTTDIETEPTFARSRQLPWRLRRPTRKAVGIGVAIVLLTASLAASGFMVWQHRALVQQRQHAHEFVTAAQAAVTSLMSLDPAHAKDNLQHTIDQTTGALKSQLEATSGYIIKNAQDQQVTTKASVNDAAVESMTDTSAVVLMVTKSETIDADKSARPPVFWRLSVNIDRQGDQLKMSKLDFVQ